MIILYIYVLINYLIGNLVAKKVIESHVNSKFSAITHLERVFAHFRLIPVTKIIAQLAAQLRRESKIKTPNAIILATAINLETKLITFDKKFQKIPHSLIVFRIKRELNKK